MSKVFPAKSICWKFYLENFAKAGISPSLVEQMFGLIGRFVQMQPDTYETCLIAALCATSPDRGVRNQTDYKILSNIQVICSSA